VPMGSDKAEGGENGHGRTKSKQGSCNLQSGPCRSFKFSLMRKQLTQLDRLALEIRAGSGNWITRSGIITAILEATSRPELLEELAARLYNRSFRGRSLKGRSPLQRERQSRTATRVRRLARYLLRKRQAASSGASHLLKKVRRHL
jgi:hypothetical protein